MPGKAESSCDRWGAFSRGGGERYWRATPAGDEAMWRTWLTRVAQAAGVVQAGLGHTGRRGAGGRAAGGGSEAPAPRVSEG
eukprot:scaffold36862_cov50-Phaeocystis_antarctica.AAC.2